jgi:hypothetical protein
VTGDHYVGQGLHKSAGHGKIPATKSNFHATLSAHMSDILPYVSHNAINLGLSTRKQIIRHSFVKAVYPGIYY